MDAARVDASLVDLSKLTKRDFEEEEDVNTDTYKGPSANDPAYYNFDTAQSVTTIQHNTEKIKTTSAGISLTDPSLGESAFSVVNDDDTVDGEMMLATSSDPLTSLQKEELQFDLSFLHQQHDKQHQDTKSDTSDTVSDEKGLGSQQADTTLDDTPARMAAQETILGSTARTLEDRFNDATTDASLAAAALGLELSSEDTEALTEIADDDCFALVLAGIDEDRSFAEMFAILDSLIEEAEAKSDEELAQLQRSNIHVPQKIRPLLVEEASESGESVLQHLLKLHRWLEESEAEVEEERLKEEEDDRPTDGRTEMTSGHICHQGRKQGTAPVLPRTVESDDKKPQGRGHSTSGSITKAGVKLVSESDVATSRLGARTT